MLESLLSPWNSPNEQDYCIPAVATVATDLEVGDAAGVENGDAPPCDGAGSGKQISESLILQNRKNGGSGGGSGLTAASSSLGRPGETLPPGPRMPCELQALRWARKPLEFMDACYGRYGETFTLRVRRRRPWVFLTNPEHIKQVFTTPAAAVGAAASEANPLLGPLLGPTSVMLRDEPHHMDDRRKLLPSFHGERMRSYGEMMTAVALEQVATWPHEEPFALWPRMQAISLEVVMRAVFGDASNERLKQLRRQLVEMTAWINNPRRLALVAASGPRPVAKSRSLRAAMRPVEELVLEEVHSRRVQPLGEDGEGILTMLERGYAENGTPMSEDKLRDELVTMLSDGPTATSLAWVFERLLAHPEKLQRLREEVEAGKSEDYLEAVVKETLRLCPTVPVVMRRLLEPIEVGGYTLPADVIAAPCVYLTHLREDLYERPREFRPERFLEAPAGTYTWIPFGGGARRCVAASFAPLEMRQVIRTVLQEVELSAAGAGAEAAMRSSVSFAPRAGAMVVARRREQGGTRVAA
ncbi:MAG: cytochrome P450 [Solirubrobacteraceae bacterium]